MRKALLIVFLLLISVSMMAADGPGDPPAAIGWPWFVWAILLFVVTTILGVVAVIGGVGGAVLYVPIVASFFPFHLDYVRCAGLVLAMAGALSAAPRLIRAGYVSLRLAFPAALIASVFSVIGALVGLALPESVVQIALGGAIIGVAVLLLVSGHTERPEVPRPDFLARALAIGGVYREPTGGERVEWTVHRTVPGYLCFIVIGLLGGMFGLGAGWANVPVLNLLMGAPLKVAVATSGAIISVTGTAASWVYVNKGAVLPLVVLPSVFGMILGTRCGARLLPRVKPRIVRLAVIVLLGVSGIQSVLKGVGG